jgi:hypothetical protein
VAGKSRVFRCQGKVEMSPFAWASGECVFIGSFGTGSLVFLGPCLTPPTVAGILRLVLRGGFGRSGKFEPVVQTHRRWATASAEACYCRGPKVPLPAHRIGIRFPG